VPGPPHVREGATEMQRSRRPVVAFALIAVAVTGCSNSASTGPRSTRSVPCSRSIRRRFRRSIDSRSTRLRLPLEDG
jgi:hypothetical protein